MFGLVADRDDETDPSNSKRPRFLNRGNFAIGTIAQLNETMLQSGAALPRTFSSPILLYRPSAQHTIFIVSFICTIGKKLILLLFFKPLAVQIRYVFDGRLTILEQSRMSTKAIAWKGDADLVGLADSTGLSDDAIQQAFFELSTNRGLLNFSPGAVVVRARSRSLDQLRQERSRKRRETIAAGRLSPGASFVEDPSCRLCQEEERLLVSDLLPLIPREYAAILAGTLQGHDPRQLATLIQIPLSTVKSRLARGRELIKSILPRRNLL